MLDVLFDVRLQDHQNHPQDHQNHPQDHHQLGLVVVLVVLVVLGVVLVVLEVFLVVQNHLQWSSLVSLSVALFEKAL